MGSILSRLSSSTPAKRPLEDVESQPQQYWSKKQKTERPPGMSKRQWKREQKKLYWEGQKDQVREFRKAKRNARKERKRAQIQERLAKGESMEQIVKTMLMPNRSSSKKFFLDQQKAGIRVVYDCDFEDKMNEKELSSLVKQIARSYSDNRRSAKYLDMEVTGFNGGMKKVFETKGKGFEHWQNVKFNEKSLKECVDTKEIDLEKTIYLSADEHENKIDTLDEGYTYIIGGLVDKNRYKGLCHEKAKELGIKTARLPIDEYVNISGRKVLTSLHVYLLLLKWVEVKDWKKAFEEVLPRKKIAEDEQKESGSAETVTETITETVTEMVKVTETTNNEDGESSKDNQSKAEVNSVEVEAIQQKSVEISRISGAPQS